MAAADAAAEGDWGKMVALQSDKICRVELDAAVSDPKTVDLDFYEQVVSPFFAG